ncbi:AGAP000555-PA-like protein [Anopheles sinensis]|uniref:Molybdenum cofactor sulfurase n=1 Tax=Anopheles sinensis TaxID=74873 RepID=A0A084VX23_ANOSI|nr:AGAP000555-PA-like protein [Anopheles sinensis]
MSSMMEFGSEYTAEESLKIEQEFSRLKGKCYLDHAGTALYGESQLRAVQELLAGDLFCNPHTSRTMEDMVDLVRYRVLRWFNTRASEYELVFTSGTTGALKLLGESFTFRSPSSPTETAEPGAFVFLRESHTSVLGMREIVQTDRIHPMERTELLQALQRSGDSTPVEDYQRTRPSLLYPLALCETVEQSGLDGYDRDKFHVCLDAASYVSTSPLNLTRYKPSFVCVSFYKIFGYPTGLGALLVRKDVEPLLLPGKRYYGGGTVKIAMSGPGGFHVKRDTLAERFEDGTINFLAICALLPCMDTLERLLGPSPMDRIQRHTFALARYCHNRLRQLEHTNGTPVVELYHDSAFEDANTQGAILNFNVRNDDGSYVGYAEVACMAANHSIYLRTGCFCNPGACQRHLGLTDTDILRQYQAGHVCGDANDLVDGKPTGSVRVSFGYCTRPADIDQLVAMIAGCYIRRAAKGPLASRANIAALYKSYDKPRLVQICLYPLKSCGAFRVERGSGTLSWPLSSTGLRYDREFVVVDEHGTAVTQKKLPGLCRIRPTIDLQLCQLTLEHPDADDRIVIDLRYPNHEQERGDTERIQLCQTKVCTDAVSGLDCGDEVAEWISLALGISGLRLLRQSPNEARLQKRTAKELSLNNQAQLLLVNRTSVRWLGEKVDDWGAHEQAPPLDALVQRFRGNLIIETTRPLEELDWRRLLIGDCQFTVDGPCTRCQMICIDQETGNRTAEPLRTISREFGGKVRFGIYMSHVNLEPGAILTCGDKLTGLIE